MNTTEPTNKGFSFVESIKTILIILAIVIPFRLFVAQPFIVNGASMYPTFESGDYLIVDQVSYRFENPARGDVVIFHPPFDQGTYFIKRIIGLPGETVSITGGTVTIFNTEHPEGLVLNEPYITKPKSDTQTITLDDTHYFVMGDNRLESYDSRMWGPLDKSEIIGTPFLQLLPLSKISIYPGEQSE